MHDFSQQLSSIRDEVVAFFAHVREASADYSSSELWENLKPEDRQRSQLTCQKLGSVVAKVSLVFKNSSTLGESAIRTLQQAVRRMDSALRLKEWVGWEASTQYSEDHAIGQTPAGEYENSVSASTAQSIFEGEIDRILRVLSFASPGPGDESFNSADKQPEIGAPASKRPRKRGPKPDYNNASRVAEIVREISPNGDWHSKLDAICKALDQAHIPAPKKWWTKEKWLRARGPEDVPKWEDYDTPGNAIKAIQYRLDKAREKLTTGILS